MGIEDQLDSVLREVSRISVELAALKSMLKNERRVDDSEVRQLSVSKAAEYYGLTYQGMYARVRKGDVPVQYDAKSGRAYLVLEDVKNHIRTGVLPD